MKVIVIGAGLAGLCCAYHLSRRGHEVEIVEARDRCGGRVITVRDWKGEYVAEGGAEFIDSHHRRLLALARHFNLPLRKLDVWDYLPPSPPGVEEFWDSLLGLSRELPSGRKPWPLPPNLARLDWVSMSEWWDELGLDRESREELEAWCRGVEASSPDDVSLLGLIVEQRLRPASAEQAAYTLEGGMDSLPRALAAACGAQGVKIHLSSAVERIEHDGSGVGVSTGSGAYEAARAVITLPAPVLARLPITPTLSEHKSAALGALKYGYLVKTLLEVRPRFWDSSDPFVQIQNRRLNSVWECSRSETGAVLVAWTSGEDARAMGALSETERIAWCLEQLEETLPGAGEHCVGGRSFNWGADPLARGAYSYFPPGFMTEHASNLHLQEGRLHFAGEHTSPFSGYMEGALESGVRAALEILKTHSGS